MMLPSIRALLSHRPRRATSGIASAPHGGRRLLRLAAAIAVLYAGAEALPLHARDVRPYDVRDYECEIRPDITHKRLSGVETITLVAVVDTLRRVELDAAEMVVHDVRDGGQPCRVENGNGTITVVLDRPLLRGERRSIVMRYDGEPHEGVIFRPDQIYTAFHTGHWMVCNEDPADKATLTLHLIVPREFSVVAAGKNVGDERSGVGLRRSTWRLAREYSAYLFGFAAGRFRDTTIEDDGVRLRMLSRDLTAGEMERTFASTLPALRYFEARSGVRFPDSVYTQALVAGESGQEVATYSWLSADYAGDVLDDPREDWLVVHELAHQWWGNLLTCASWSDMWLNEGFATFMTSAFKEFLWGREEYERDILLHRFRYERQRSAGNDRPLHYTAWDTPEEANGPIAYYKGAAVLNLLRYQLGEPAFWEGIRIYTGRGVGRSVTSNDLKAAMESASGEDLTPFFQHWVFEALTPEVAAAFAQSDSGVTITITERQKDSAWTFPVQVAVQTAAGRESRRVLLHGRSTEVTFRTSAPLLSVRFDDGGHLPVRVIYDRPLSMLRWQAKNEPDVAGRVEALQLLARSGQEQKAASETSEVDDLFDASAATDPSRLVRQVASGLLKQLRSGSEK